MKTERSYNFSTSKSIKSLLKPRPYDRKHPLFSAATAMRKTYPHRI